MAVKSATMARFTISPLILMAGILAPVPGIFGSNCTDQLSTWNPFLERCECLSGLTALPIRQNNNITETRCVLSPLVRTSPSSNPLDDLPELSLQGSRIRLRVWDSTTRRIRTVDVTNELDALKDLVTSLQDGTYTKAEVHSIVAAEVANLPTVDMVDQLRLDVTDNDGDILALQQTIQSKADVSDVYTISQIDQLLQTAAEAQQSAVSSLETSVTELEERLDDDYMTAQDVNDKFDSLELDAWTEKNTGACINDDLGLIRYNTARDRIEACTKASTGALFWWPVNSPRDCTDTDQAGMCIDCIQGTTLIHPARTCVATAEYFHLTFDGSSINQVQTGYRMAMDSFGFGSNQYREGPHGHRALYFDGSNDWLRFESIPILSGPMTACAFVNFEAFNRYSRVFDLGSGSGGTNVLMFNVEFGRDLAFEIHRGGTSRRVVLSNGLWVGHNSWIHTCATVESNGLMRLYRNGALVSQLNGFPPTHVDRSYLYIGESHWSGDGFFRGQLADLRIYTRALNHNEVRAIACNGQHAHRPALCDELIGWFRFEDNLEDSSVAAWHAGINGADFPDRYVDGPEGTMALRLARRNDFVILPNRVLGGSSFAVCFWVKYRSFGQFSNIVGFGSGTPNNNFFISNLGTGPGARFGYFAGTNGVTWDYGDMFAPSLNRFVHYCFGLHNNEMYIYRNGHKVGTRDMGAQRMPTVARNAHYFGRSLWGGDALLDADIDDLRFYIRELSDDDVAALRCGTKPALDCKGVISILPLAKDTLDVSGHGLSARLHGTASTTFASASGIDMLEFDGSSTYLTLPHGRIGGAFSFCANIRYDNFRQWSRIIDFGVTRNVGLNNIIISNVGTTSQLYWGIRRGSTSRSLQISNFWAPAHNRFRHVCFTVDDVAFRAYMDGQLRGTAGGWTAYYVDRPLSYIGRSMWDSDALFDGAMYDVRMYDYSLSADEIKTLAGVGI